MVLSADHRIKYYEGGGTEGAVKELRDISHQELRPPPRASVRHRVVRLIKEPPDVERGHPHAIGVETATVAGRRRWSLVEFVQAVRLGERFYLEEGAASIEIGTVTCDRCSWTTIAPIGSPSRS